MWNAHTKLSEDGRWSAPNKLPPPQKQYTRTRRRHTNQDIVRYVHTLRIQYTLSETNLSRSAEQQQVLRVSSLCWNCLRVEETDLRKKGKGRESRVDSFCSHAKWRMHSLKFKAKIVDYSKSCRVVGNNRCNRFISVIAAYGSPSVSTFIHWVLKESSIPSI